MNEQYREVPVVTIMGDASRECLDNLPLAMAYVPMQEWKMLYEPDVGLSRGTIFQQLDLPFLGKRAVEE